MPRRTEIVVVQASGGRDDGKHFKITEMPAAHAAKWGDRFFIAIKGTSGHIPQEFASLGMIGVAICGVNAALAAPMVYSEIEPLMDELLACVTVIRDQRHPDVASERDDDDIEEVATIYWLRSEVVRVHTGFSFADALSTFLSTLAAASAASSST